MIISVTAGFGVAIYAAGESDFDDTRLRAGLELEPAKQGGGNRVICEGSRVGQSSNTGAVTPL